MECEFAGSLNEELSVSSAKVSRIFSNVLVTMFFLLLCLLYLTWFHFSFVSPQLVPLSTDPFITL